MAVKNNLKDQTITCCDCGNDFIFSVRDQLYFKQMDFAPKKRCKSCKEAKKRKYESIDAGIDC